MVLGLAEAGADPEKPGFTRADDAVTLRAERATEHADGQSFLVDGALVLGNHRWIIRADSALVSGRLDDPERIEVRGEPATLTVNRAARGTPLVASSRHLVFEPRREIVRLRENATVEDGDKSISSDVIRYVIETDTFTAGDGGRVKVVTRPKARL